MRNFIFGVSHYKVNFASILSLFLSYTFIIISLTVYGSCGRDFSGDVGAFAVTTTRNRNTPDSCIVRINVTEGKLAIIRFKTIIMNCSTDFIEVWKNVEIQ